MADSKETNAQGPAVVVTGASTGIGRATALLLDREGFRVFAGVRKVSDGEAVRQSASPRLTPLLLDVTKAESIAEALRQVEKDVGDTGLQGLVNNAGVSVNCIFEFLDIDELRNVLEVNLVGAVAVTKAFLPALRRAKGRIVNISSENGYMSTPFMTTYSASKFGLEAVSDALRRELRPFGLEVVVIQPAAIQSDIWEKGHAHSEKMRAALPPEAVNLYGEMYENFEALLDKLSSKAPPAEAVATAVHRALTARRPKVRVQVGDAKTSIWLHRLLPARTVDALVAKTFS